MHNWRKTFVSGCLIGGLLMTGASHAAEVTEDELYVPEATGPIVTATGRHTFESDIDATGSQITISESDVAFSQEHKFKDVLPVSLRLRYGHVDISENSPVELPSHLESFMIGLGTKFPVPFMEMAHHFIGLDVMPEMNTDDGKWSSSAFRVPTRIYWINKRSEDLIFILGAYVTPDYDREVAPLFGFIYRPNDRLSFNFASGTPNIAYKLNDQTTLLWDFSFRYSEYEVTRNGQEGVVLKYTNYASGVAVEHNWNNSVQTVFGLGAVFGRQLEYEDDNGKVVPEPGLYAEFRLTANFW